MKKILIALFIIVAAYFVYVNFIAPPTKEAAKKVEEKVFTGPYSQTKAAKQVEAKQYASVLMNKQHEYFVVHGKYASDISELGFTPRFGQYYEAKVIKADDNNFKIEISGNIDSDSVEDLWEVDRDGFTNTVNDITR